VQGYNAFALIGLDLITRDRLADFWGTTRWAKVAGLRWCRWGGYDHAGNRATQAAKPASGPLCEACDARQSATVAAS
jgi:hypothetical protein